MSGFRPILVIGSMMVLVGLVGLLMTKQGNANGSQTVELASETPICAPREDNPQRTILPIGAKVVDFELRNLDGKVVKLSRELARKPVVIELFATWCPHCQESAPMVKALHQAYGNKVSFLAINAGDRPGEPSTSQQFKTQHNIQWPILEAPSEAMMSAYCLESFPLFYVVDPSGTVQFNHAGSLKDKPAVDKAFRAALDKVAQKAAATATEKSTLPAAAPATENPATAN